MKIKRLLAIYFLFILFPHSIYSQTDSDLVSSKHKQPSSAFVSINGGFGIPTNGFYIDNIISCNGVGSYGSIGYTINISGEFPIAHSRFGVATLISYNSELFDVNQCFLDTYSVGENKQLISSNYSDFNETLFMAGAFLSLGRKSTISFRLLVGDNICTVAGYSFMGNSSYGSVNPSTGAGINHIEDLSSSLLPASSSAIAYDFGVNIRVLQKKHLFGELSSDFMYSQAYINTIYDNFQVHCRVNYNLLSLTAGVGYKI